MHRRPNRRPYDARDGPAFGAREPYTEWPSDMLRCRNLLTFSLLATALLCVSASGSELAAVDSLYSAAAAAFQDRNFARAASGYADVLALIEAGADEGGTYLAERRRRAGFLMARSLEGAERWDDAIDAYTTALEETPLLSDHVLMSLARCHLERDEFATATGLLREVVDAPARTTLYLTAVEQLGDAHMAAGERDVAVQWYRVLLKERSGYNDRARAHYKIGLAMAARGDRESALESFATAVDEFPRSFHAYEALREARNSSRSFTDRYHQGLVLYNRKKYREAADLFKYYLRHESDAELRSAASYFLGRSHQRMGSYGSAAGDYEDVIEYGPDDEYFDLAWSKLAYCRRVTGRLETSLETYDAFADAYPERGAAAELLWEKSRLLEEKLRWDEAIESYGDLARRHPDSSRTQDALFRAGLCLFKLERYEEADAAFAALSIGRRGEDAARAFFWAGKSREALGGSEGAAARYQEAVDSARDSYYGRRALELLGSVRGGGAAGGGDPVAPAEDPGPSPARQRGAVPMPVRTPDVRGQMGYPFRMISGLQGFAAWLAEWYPLVYVPGERIQLVRMLRADPSFQRADAFMALHMQKEAEAELSLLEDSFGSDPRMLDIMIGYYEGAGLHKRAIGLAEWILELSPVESLGDAPHYLRRKMCPVHFEGLVVAECAERGVDPELLLSLIRQESLFEPDAVSWVGARGLSQIMPATGTWIARRLGERSFRTNDLFDPATNVRFGTYYLSVQLEEFDGDALRALAAYNGGPDNVPRWWGYGGGRDSDVFVEDIGYSQTNDYVRRVYLYGEFYKELASAPR
ncbi:MAG: transglycosylase SLT domain-containing protein [Candidatus Eisenbacteria bacterium]